ncbi:flagellar protein FlbD [Thermosyntropha lipolytica DSM 11003]|uniref:Flagellar protein FlbD n=1 Tax=Thermosyntropha lipolytica DSM 11003 TaxID=1123382 RepID=A0A1M5L0W8_9FIRM|nr:flagellar FlbD family protein [Thermosyntropha lipolytica]SHG58073.1 flagellar protein FlbD [Thermosyntropha lipolytica DSM 11003]
MIYLTRLNGGKIAVNLDLIEFMEETPDTVITLTTGRKFVVKETMAEIRKEIIKFKKEVFLNLKE